MKTKKTIYISLSVFAIALLILFLFGKNLFQSAKLKEIHLAVIGPMNKKTDAGNTFVRAAQLVLDQYNHQIEKDGYRIVLKTYNDQNNKDIAREQALKIGESQSILGVIGHNYSSVSMIGGEIYKEKKIPAISPTATSNEVTTYNNWYFRTIFTDDAQGRFLANYARAILKQSYAIIIHEDQIYGKTLSDIFKKTAVDTGMKIEAKYNFNASSDTLDSDLEILVNKIVNSNSDTLIFLASHYQEGSRIIRRLKDRGLKNIILTPDAFAHQEFVNTFDEFHKEILKPGYYSNDIYVALPIHYDVASQQAQEFYKEYAIQYGIQPDWRAAFAYDATLLFINAIKKKKILTSEQSLEMKRASIREFLSNINRSDRAVPGVTGLNYFDKHGNSSKPITMGQYRNKEIIPAMTQLNTVSDIEDIPNLEEVLKDGWVIRIGEDYMYKTNIVFTGVQINEVRDIDVDDLSYTLESEIWFRYGGTVDVRDIEFLNAAQNVQLRAPLEEHRLGKQLYRRYKATGRFKADFLFPSGPHKHVLGISFSHKSVPRHNLIFVPDKVGGTTSWDQTMTESRKIIGQSSNWIVEQLWSFQDIHHRDILGNIKYINSPDKKINFSQFVTGMEICEKTFQFRNRLISCQIAFVFMIISALTWICFENRPQLINRIYLLTINLKRNRDAVPEGRESRRAGFSYDVVEEKPEDTKPLPPISRKTGWLVSSIALLLFLFCVEIISVHSIYKLADAATLEKVIELFQILWWVVPTHIISLAINEFIWRFIETSTRHKIPRFLKALVTFFLYLFMGFGVMAFVYDQKVTSILGSSGIFVMIIGLAIQMNISNIFAGTVLNMERSINVGDWIKIGNGQEGKVLEFNWRTTKIQTREDIIQHIPNNTISEADFQNYTTPNNIVCLCFFIELDKNVSFLKVKKTILRALENVELVLRDPAPAVKFNQFTYYSARYTIVYNIDDYGKKNVIKGLIWESILYHLKKENINSASLTMNFDRMIGNDR